MNQHLEWLAAGFVSHSLSASSRQLHLHVELVTDNGETSSAGRPEPEKSIADRNEVASSVKNSDRDPRAARFLQRLYTSTCLYVDSKDRNSERIEGTCEWFTGHDKFQHWLSDPSARLLWVSADPGCGKSVLSRYLIDKFLKSRNSIICYFFFKDGLIDQQNSKSALCALLHQLFTANNGLLQHSILAEFDQVGGKFAESFHTLWSTLTRVANDTEEVICVLDALDECQETDRSQLIQAVVGLQGKSSKLKFLLTSRPYSDIHRDFRRLETQVPTIHLSGEGDVEVLQISKEISLVIKKRVEDIGMRRSLSSGECAFLLEKLEAVPNQTYVWVTLTLDVVENLLEITKGAVRESIEHLPQTVDEAYEKILGRCKDPIRARRLLHIVAAAREPLSLEQIQVALAMRHDRKSLADTKSEDLEPLERFKDALRDLCGLCLVVNDEKVYFFHQTVREFLISDQRPRGTRDGSTLRWKHTLQEEDSHRVLAEICLRYILLDGFETSEALDHSSRESAADDSSEDSEDDHFENPAISEAFYQPLHIYAASNWAFHFRTACIKSRDVLVDLAIGICEANQQKYRLWASISNDRGFVWDEWLPPSNPRAMTVAARYGLEGVIAQLLEEGVSTDSGYGEFGRTPLSWAARSGHEATARLLIEAGADVDSKDKIPEFTPLHKASALGYELIVRLLLENGADLDSRDNRGTKPLHLASRRGKKSTVRLLLEHGADLESRNNKGFRPLHLASRRGEESTVRLLLEKGAASDPRGDGGKTPLHSAAKYRFERLGRVNSGAVPRLLVEYGAHVDSRDDEGQTPLFDAIESEDLETADILLGLRADANAMSSKGETPLISALRTTEAKLVELLLNCGAIIDLKDEHGQPPLLKAAAWEDLPADWAVEALLDRGATIDIKDNMGRTALSWAARNGWASRVRLLLDYSANVDLQDSDHCAPLLLTTKGVVSRYMASYMSSETSDEESETASQTNDGPKDSDGTDERFSEDVHYPGDISTIVARRRNMFWKTVKKEISDDSLSENEIWQHEIKQRWRKEIVEMLLDKGACIDTEDAEGRTPIWWARYNENEGLAQLLSERISEQSL